jgi:hypothetical protein
MSHDNLQVIYDYPSKTVLLQLGHRSHVLKNLSSRDAAEKAARDYAGQFWPAVHPPQGDQFFTTHTVS